MDSTRDKFEIDANFDENLSAHQPWMLELPTVMR